MCTGNCTEGSNRSGIFNEVEDSTEVDGAREARSESLPLRKYSLFVLATSNHCTQVTAHGLPKVEKPYRFAKRTRRQMHVPKRHAERRVTHELLDSLRRCAPHGKVRAEGMPKHMGNGAGVSLEGIRV